MKVKAWDDYVYPGTDVLRNKPGFRSKQRLEAFEQRASYVRLIELFGHPVAGEFDYAHMKAIHRRLFQDVYEWAGEERVGPLSPQTMSKDGLDVSGGPSVAPGPEIRSYHYYPSNFIAEDANTQYRKLADKGFLVGLPFDEFVAEFAERWAEINVIHAFREGNTRSQFVFFHQLAGNAGYSLDTAQFRIGQPLRDEFVHARFYAHENNSSWLAEVLSKALTPAAPPAAATP